VRQTHDRPTTALAATGVDLSSRDFRAGYLSGACRGWLDGYDAAEADLAAVWAQVAERVRRLTRGDSVPFAEVRRRRADRTGSRPAPTPQECARSWLPVLAERARRDGATDEQVAALLAAEMRPYGRPGGAA
jgi:hypothetical protein